MSIVSRCLVWGVFCVFFRYRWIFVFWLHFVRTTNSPFRRTKVKDKDWQQLSHALYTKDRVIWCCSLSIGCLLGTLCVLPHQRDTSNKWTPNRSRGPFVVLMWSKSLRPLFLSEHFIRGRGRVFSWTPSNFIINFIRVFGTRFRPKSFNTCEDVHVSWISVERVEEGFSLSRHR